LKQHIPRFRQGEPTPTPFEELLSGLRFELAQLHADGRGRSVQPSGRMRETAELDADDERAERIHIEVQRMSHFRFDEVTISNHAIFKTIRRP
jgi:hypothetical protein